MADLASAIDAEVLVVAAAGLGTLNATALTCGELRGRHIACAGVVIGSWPPDPDLAMRTNLADLPEYAGAPLLGVLAEGLGAASKATFLAAARSGLAPELGGAWDGNQPRASSGGAPASSADW
jgi:dethiobiotin synthetase